MSEEGGGRKEKPESVGKISSAASDPMKCEIVTEKGGEPDDRADGDDDDKKEMQVNIAVGHWADAKKEHNLLPEYSADAYNHVEEADKAATWQVDSRGMDGPLHGSSFDAEEALLASRSKEYHHVQGYYLTYLP